VSLASLRREWDKALSTRPGSRRADVPVDPVEFAISVGIVPDDWQADVLTSKHPRKILCCGRQTGKTTVAAVLVIHKAITQPGSTTLIVAPGERQAKLLFSKAFRLYRIAGYPLPAHSERRTGLELANGSIIEALPAVERTTRGYSVDSLICDEAAAVPDMDYHGILPALIATQGEQVLLSTPRGKRGFFHELWHSGDDWQRVMVRSDQVGRIRPEDLEVFRSSMPAQFFEQEFYCAWLDTEGSLFSYADIQAALAAGDEVEAVTLEEDEW
jgi:hypothetical protein